MKVGRKMSGERLGRRGRGAIWEEAKEELVREIIREKELETEVKMVR